MTRRLLLSYVSIIVLVLILLEVPLGVALADAERQRLETDIQRDAFALVLRSEESLEDTPTGANPDLQALAELYQKQEEGRVVFVDANGSSVADSDPPLGDDGTPQVDAELSHPPRDPHRTSRQGRQRGTGIRDAGDRPPVRRGTDRDGW